MAEFQFDVGFQRAILRLMMIDDVFCMNALKHVQPGFFTARPLGWIFKIFNEHWDQYHMVCGEIPLRNAIRHVSPEQYASYWGEVEAVIGLGNVADSDYVKTELTDFCRRNLFSIAHQESARLFNAGKHVEAYDVTARTQDDMRRIDFGDVDRQWFFEELPERQRERYRKRMTTSAFATGVGDLDRATDGGVKLGELWSVIAYAKRGKTTWLCNQGYNAIRMYGAPVLHVIAEGHGSQISAKYDALFSGELYRAVKYGDIDSQRYAAMQAEYQQKRQRLVIRTFNDWDVNIMDVKGELDELKSYGFRPELLIVDYVDLLRSRYKADSETAHQIAGTRDLKRLINQEGIAGWTGFQAQRPKPNAHSQEHILTAGNVADAYAKVRIVDAWGSLNATDEEMKRGEMRLFWEGHRDAEVNKCWLISNDLDRQKMVNTAVEHYAGGEA